MAVVELIFDVKSPAWVTGNTNVPKNGEPIFLNNGSFAFGDGVTQVQALTFFSPSSSAVWGSISGVITNQTDLINYINSAYTNGAGLTLTGTQFSITTAGVTSAMLANNAVNLTTSVVTGVLPIAKGGTNSSASISSNNAIFANAAGTAMVSASDVFYSDTKLGVGVLPTNYKLEIFDSLSTSAIFSLGNVFGFAAIGFDSLGGYFQPITASTGFSFYNAAGDSYLQVKDIGDIIINSATNNTQVQSHVSIGGLFAPTAHLDIASNTAANAALRIRESGTNVTAPNNGDVWYNGRLFFRDQTVTETIAYLSDISVGSGINRREAYLLNY